MLVDEDLGLEEALELTGVVVVLVRQANLGHLFRRITQCHESLHIGQYVMAGKDGHVLIGALLGRAIMEALCRHENLLRALLPSDDGSLAQHLALGLEDAYVDAGLLLGKNADGLSHRMHCAFAAWAHVGLVVRWIAETKRPLTEESTIFQELQAGVTATATRLLME